MEPNSSSASRTLRYTGTLIRFGLPLTCIVFVFALGIHPALPSKIRRDVCSPSLMNVTNHCSHRPARADNSGVVKRTRDGAWCYGPLSAEEVADLRFKAPAGPAAGWPLFRECHGGRVCIPMTASEHDPA